MEDSISQCKISNPHFTERATVDNVKWSIFRFKTLLYPSNSLSLSANPVRHTNPSRRSALPAS
jgi:hypothetical protein